MADPNASPFAGDWIYRSFLNLDTYPVETGDDAQTLKNFQALLFGTLFVFTRRAGDLME